MYRPSTRLLSSRKKDCSLCFQFTINSVRGSFSRTAPIVNESIRSYSKSENPGSSLNNYGVFGVRSVGSGNAVKYNCAGTYKPQHVQNFCTFSDQEIKDECSNFSGSSGDTFQEVADVNDEAGLVSASSSDNDVDKSYDDMDSEIVDGTDFEAVGQQITESKFKSAASIDFTKIRIDKLPTVVLVGRPNVGKSALFNRLIRRREALVYNTPNDHVTRDVREGVAKLGNLRFRVLDSAGLEAEASSGSVLSRTAGMTKKVLEQSQFAIFLLDARDGLEPMDQDVGRWLRKHASGIKTVVVLNKAESLDFSGTLTVAAREAYTLGFGEPIALSAETGFGLIELYDTLRPLLEDFVLQYANDDTDEENTSGDTEESKLPMQLAIVGRPNVGKSTLLNAILQEDRVLVGPEAGLTRDSIRVEFEYEGRTIYLVDTAGWLDRTKKERGPSTLSIVQSRKHLMRAHVVALVLDAEEIAKSRRTLNHAEVVIARRAVEEGRGLVVIVNKIDLLKGKGNSKIYETVLKAVPEEVQTVIPQVTGIPVVFVSALEGKGRIAVMKQIVGTYEKWCMRLPTARLNRWLRKVMSRHSWKDLAAQPKIKYFTQVKARPPTFVAFLTGKNQLSDTDIRFLTKSLKEDFDIGGIPIRITQRSVLSYAENKKALDNAESRKSLNNSKNRLHSGKPVDRMMSDKRSIIAEDSIIADESIVST